MTRPLSGQGPQTNQLDQTNSTLNHLMPGRQKSWMTNNTTSGQTSNRPASESLRRMSGQSQNPAQQQQQQQLGQQAQVERQRQLQRQGPERDEQTFPSHQSQHAPTYVDSTCPCNKDALCPYSPGSGCCSGNQQASGSKKPIDKRLTGLVHSTPANVLPSPAPSDEPSPAALSNHKDSPNPQTISLAAVARGRQGSGTIPTASGPAMSIDPSMLTNLSPSALEPQNVDASSPVEQAVYGILAQAVQSPGVMPPPDPPSMNQYGQAQDGAVASNLGVHGGFLEGQLQPNLSGPDDHQDKRRRVE